MTNLRTLCATALAVSLCTVGCSSKPEKSDTDSQADEVAEKPDDEAVPDDEKPGDPSERAKETEPATQPTTAAATPGDPEVADGERGLAKATAGQIARRVDESRERLQKTESGRLIWKSIEAHGTLSRWFTYGPLHFRFDYRPLGDRPPHDTYQTVDQWASRARHQLASDRDVEFGWDGIRAWVKPPDAEIGYNARFWALTPYYFVGIPFVLADPGVNVEMVGEQTFEGETYDVVKATFEDDVGDAPDDYYIVYVDRDSRRVGAVRYVVSYPGFFKDGKHSDEKLMSYDGNQEIEGIHLAESYRTFTWDGDEHGKKVTETTLSEVEFRPETPESHFDVPEGAKAIEGY